MINNKFIKIIDDIKLYDKYIIQRKIIQGIKVLFKSLNINENDPTYLNIESITGENNKNKFISKALEFLKNNNIENNKDILEFLHLLNKYPEALKWLINNDENTFLGIYKFIIDSGYNKYISLTNLLGIKNYFKNLTNKTAKEIFVSLNELDNVKNNQKLKENIIFH